MVIIYELHYESNDSSNKLYIKGGAARSLRDRVCRISNDSLIKGMP